MRLNAGSGYHERRVGAILRPEVTAPGCGAGFTQSEDPMSRMVPWGRRPATRAGLLVLTAVLAVSLAACGGGGGGGGGGNFSTKIHVLLVNHTQKDVNVTSSTGAPLDSSQSKPPIASCKSGVIDFPLQDPFTISVDGKVVIDSTQLPTGIPNQGQSDVVTQIDANKDGSVVFDSVRVGSKISPPAELGICF